ncbi:MAG: TauD/TfdA family dioxygenase, partial [Coleofasciculus sp. S288]|nr:TauD/TfdA family dioxygenase [Coleofasciculus sp. S288]
YTISLAAQFTNQFFDAEGDIIPLSASEIKELFKSSGILVFRGFGVNYNQLKAFAEQVSSSFVRDETRPVVDSNGGVIQLVDEGADYIAPHCEHATTPFRPDVIWFCCEVPAAQDGETLFWDGVQVWQALSKDVKQLFLSQKIKFFHEFSVENWKLFLGERATIADVHKLLDGLEGVNYRINDDESVYMDYVCSAVVKTKYGHDDAFANSLLLQHGKETVTFEDNSPIPDGVIDEINKVMDSMTGVIDWQPGDLAMIDNSRFLHGRRAFEDNNRKIFSTLTMLKD